MPVYTDCGFTPTTLLFAPTALFPTPQYTQVTFFTNVNPAVISPTQASLGWSWLAMGGSIFLLVVLRRKGSRPEATPADFSLRVGAEQFYCLHGLW